MSEPEPAPVKVRDTYDIIHLSNSEWGNEFMEKVAREWFEDNQTVQFVEVHEHGGWWLGYRRDMSIWSTANDAAHLNQPLPRPSRYSGATVRRVDQCERPNCVMHPGHTGECK